jgi:pimeloyl-ACP methyl ester carboxylesterase
MPAEAEYCPFPITTDPRPFGLTTSTLALRSGQMVVRHGRRTGSDTATILLHGAAGSWSTWTPLLSAETRSFPLTDLVIPDLPGWGDSPLPFDEDSLTIESMAELVAEAARALGYRRWVVIGHSMGGFIALQLASAAARETTFVGLVSATTFSVVESARHPFTRFRVLPGYAMLEADIHWLAPYRTDSPRRIRLLIDFLVAQFQEAPWEARSPETLRAAPPG